MPRKRESRIRKGMKFSEIPYFLNTAEVEDLTGLKQPTICKAIREGKIRAETVLGEYRIFRDDLFPLTKEAHGE